MTFTIHLVVVENAMSLPASDEFDHLLRHLQRHIANIPRLVFSHAEDKLLDRRIELALLDRKSVV